VQKAVCARYVGQGVGEFSHAWSDSAGPPASRATDVPAAGEDGGVIRATYGPVRLVANLGPAPRAEGPDELAGYGFAASAPGMSAGWLSRAGKQASPAGGVAFTVEATSTGADAWVYAPPGAAVAIRLPAGTGPAGKAAVEGAHLAPAEIRDGVLSLKLPAHANPQPRLWHVRIENN
jgi:hypothetical protein